MNTKGGKIAGTKARIGPVKGAIERLIRGGGVVKEPVEG